MVYDAIIVGGGAAGMMAAITAAGLGKSVLLLDRNGKLGKKLAITGKGRCNVTNNCSVDELIKNIPVNSRFLYSAFSQFSSEDTMSFFEGLGVRLKTERGNRVFPESDKAAEIVSALTRTVSDYGVTVRNERVTEILSENGEIKGVVTEKSRFYGNGVIIATGGKSYPLTGSTGDGYDFAKACGHTVVTPTASLVPIVTEEKYPADMMGLSLKNVTLNITDKTTGKRIFSEQGEMLFTHFGVSGPIVLSASSHIRESERGRYLLTIDMKPALSEEKLDLRLQRDFAERINKDYINCLGGLLPSKMIPVFVKLSGIAGDTKVNQITREQRKSIVSLLKAFPMTMKCFRPVDEAIITSGGVSVKEISPKTMESKLVKGLYFAGEVIDVDAYTGGFNLQIAFSTGYVAGMNV
ncbi:MAG: NAD(P)/FAD-dependent oxidoreductase [Ruminococcus sp.]|nr:NAD(P)/FAD-dependent oxidoreductase [Ruminococcus sp.]